MRRQLKTGLAAAAVAAAFVVCAAPAMAQDRPVDRAFAHYEKIRASLAKDTTDGVATEARALAPLAADVGGEGAGRAVESLVQAGDIKQAREAFGAVSDALVPKFLEAGVTGVQGFMCSMNNRRWAQRGTTPDNPYFGKAMATCGAPIKSAGK